VVIFVGGANRDPTLTLDGLPGIDQKIEKHLVELPGITGDPRDVSKLAVEFDVILEFVMGENQSVFQSLVDVSPDQFGFVEPCETPQTMNDIVHAFGAGFDDAVGIINDLQKTIHGGLVSVRGALVDTLPELVNSPH